MSNAPDWETRYMQSRLDRPELSNDIYISFPEWAYWKMTLVNIGLAVLCWLVVTGLTP